MAVYKVIDITSHKKNYRGSKLDMIMCGLILKGSFQVNQIVLLGPVLKNEYRPFIVKEIRVVGEGTRRAHEGQLVSILLTPLKL